MDSPVQAAPGQAPTPPGIQAPIRSVTAAKRTGQLEGPGGWKEAFEDEIERCFVEIRSTKVVPACRRRKAIADHGRGKTHTLRLVVPCEEKRNAEGFMIRKKVRITAGDLVSFELIPDKYSANFLAGENSRYMTQLELQLKDSRTAHKDRGGGLLPREAARHREAKRQGNIPPPRSGGVGRYKRALLRRVPARQARASSDRHHRAGTAVRRRDVGRGVHCLPRGIRVRANHRGPAIPL